MDVIKESGPISKIRRQRLDPARRKAGILAAARKELEKKGYQNLTVPGIVRRAGVAQGSFYRYFKNVDDVLITLFQETLVPPILQAAGRLDFQKVKNAADLERVLFDWYRSLGELIAGHGILMREILTVVPYSGGTAAAVVADFLEKLRRWGQEVMEQVNGLAPFRKVDSRVVSHAVLGMITAATIQAAGEGLEVAAWAREMARLEGGGLLLAPWLAAGSK